MYTFSPLGHNNFKDFRTNLPKLALTDVMQHYDVMRAHLYANLPSPEIHLLPPEINLMHLVPTYFPLTRSQKRVERYLYYYLQYITAKRKDTHRNIKCTLYFVLIFQIFLTVPCGHADMRVCGYADTQVCGYVEHD